MSQKFSPFDFLDSIDDESLSENSDQVDSSISSYSLSLPDSFMRSPPRVQDLKLESLKGDSQLINKIIGDGAGEIAIRKLSIERKQRQLENLTLREEVNMLRASLQATKENLRDLVLSDAQLASLAKKKEEDLTVREFVCIR